MQKQEPSQEELQLFLQWQCISKEGSSHCLCKEHAVKLLLVNFFMLGFSHMLTSKKRKKNLKHELQFAAILLRIQLREKPSEGIHKESAWGLPRANIQVWFFHAILDTLRPPQGCATFCKPSINIRLCHQPRKEEMSLASKLWSFASMKISIEVTTDREICGCGNQIRLV